MSTQSTNKHEGLAICMTGVAMVIAIWMVCFPVHFRDFVLGLL